MQTPLISRALQRCARLRACLWLTGRASTQTRGAYRTANPASIPALPPVNETPEVLHGPRSPMYARK